MPDRPFELLAQVNKRLTLNLLIQGCAQHAFLTAHYLVRDELDAFDPRLIPLYDKFALAGFAQYWWGGGVVLIGHPAIFWRRATRFGHAFARHPLLARHGLALATAAKIRARDRCRAKGVTRIPVVFDYYTIYLLNRIAVREDPHTAALTELARRATHEIWGVPQERLDAKITRSVSFGSPRLPTTLSGIVLRIGAAGYGGVLRDGGDGAPIRVVARAWNWPILAHELVKGTAELVCLHGLAGLDDATCARVLREADRIEYEPWMLQAGSELWRRFLALRPPDRPLAEIMMHLARLPPSALESLMLAILEDPPLARDGLARLEDELA